MLPAKFALRLSGKNGTPPFTAFSSIDGSAYGQLTSSAAFPCSNASRAVPASVRVTEGSAPGAVATDFMICNALTVAARCAGVSVRVTVLPSSESTWPPALSSSVLNQTTTPSVWLDCTQIRPFREQFVLLAGGFGVQRMPQDRGPQRPGQGVGGGVGLRPTGRVVRQR